KEKEQKYEKVNHVHGFMCCGDNGIGTSWIPACGDHAAAKCQFTPAERQFTSAKCEYATPRREYNTAIRSNASAISAWNEWHGFADECPRCNDQQSTADKYGADHQRLG